LFFSPGTGGSRTSSWAGGEGLSQRGSYAEKNTADSTARRSAVTDPPEYAGTGAGGYITDRHSADQCAGDSTSSYMTTLPQALQHRLSDKR